MELRYEQNYFCFDSSVKLFFGKMQKKTNMVLTVVVANSMVPKHCNLIKISAVMVMIRVSVISANFVSLVFERKNWYPVPDVALALIYRSTRDLLLATSCGFALKYSTPSKLKRRTLRRSLQS